MLCDRRYSNILRRDQIYHHTIYVFEMFFYYNFNLVSIKFFLEYVPQYSQILLTYQFEIVQIHLSYSPIVHELQQKYGQNPLMISYLLL